jgi:hypothetical protein
VAPLIFYFEKVLAKSEQGARKILVLNKDDGTVPENGCDLNSGVFKNQALRKSITLRK